MKLALVRRAFSPVGGAELYLQRLLAGLSAAGHELHLLTEDWENPPEGVFVHFFEIRGIWATRANRPLIFAEAVRESLKLHRFDCVFSLERTFQQDVYRAGDGVHRMWLARRRRYLPRWRALWTGGFHRTMLRLEQETFRPENTRFVIVNSEMVRNEITSCFSFPSERIVLVRNGVEVARFRNGRRDETRRKYNLAPDDFVCLFAGSGWERKGLKFVIDALPEAQTRLGRNGVQLKLVVAGKGKAISSNPNIVFAGAVADVENLYAAADLFTFVPIYEPSANVCVEALAAGLPVVTSRYNGASELITNAELGAVLEEPSDRARLADEIVRFATKPHRARVSLPQHLLSIERNVAETITVLECAAKTRGETPR